MKSLDDFINCVFPPVEDKPGYVWINKRNHEIAKIDLIKEKIENFYEQYRILQENLKSNNTKKACIPLCKGLQADMVIIDEFLTEEDQDGNNS
jgi:hypothetical protein